MLKFRSVTSNHLDVIISCSLNIAIKVHRVVCQETEMWNLCRLWCHCNVSLIIVQESAAFFARTGLGELPQVVLNGYPLKREDLKGEFEETVVSTILRQTGELQKAVYNVSVRCGDCIVTCILLLLTIIHTLWTEKKHAKMFLPYLPQNPVDSDKIWYTFSWINCDIVI